MEVSVLNLDTANIENIEIDKNEVMELIKNTSCCRVYDKIFPMCCKTKDKIYT